MESEAEADSEEKYRFDVKVPASSLTDCLVIEVKTINITFLSYSKC